MMNVRRGADAYRQIEARSRSPLELVVMLYDGALRFTAAAADAHRAGDRARRGEAITRCLSILNELQSTLNLTEGGDVARELDRLYVYMQQRLLEVTLHDNADGLAEVQRLLQPLRASWATITDGGGQ